MTRLVLIVLILVAGCGEVDPTPDAALLPAPAGSVPRGAAASRAILEAGPIEVEGGERSYLTFCAPCHGAGGAGDGAVIERGFTRPLPFSATSTDPARTVAIITHGYGAMLPQAHQIPPAERWAIARHVELLARDD